MTDITISLRCCHPASPAGIRKGVFIRIPART
jgi:hypothetical protein